MKLGEVELLPSCELHEEEMLLLMKRLELDSSPYLRLGSRFGIMPQSRGDLVALIHNMTSGGAFFVIRAENTTIGFVRLLNIHWVDSKAELEIAIIPRLRGKGYGTAAVELMCRYAFDTLNLDKVYLGVFANNAPAIRTYTKAGFVTVAKLERDLYSQGKYVDRLIMSRWNSR